MTHALRSRASSWSPTCRRSAPAVPGHHRLQLAGARRCVKKANGRVDGFIVEGPTAGGHNAPPRGELTAQRTRRADLRRARRRRPRQDRASWGCPSGWPAATARPDVLCAGAGRRGRRACRSARRSRYCAESGLRDDSSRPAGAGAPGARPTSSPTRWRRPTGFPFKVVPARRHASRAGVLPARPRICDLGYLREAYRDARRRRSASAARPNRSSVYVSKGGRSGHGRPEAVSATR